MTHFKKSNLIVTDEDFQKSLLFFSSVIILNDDGEIIRRYMDEDGVVDPDDKTGYFVLGQIVNHEREDIRGTIKTLQRRKAFQRGTVDALELEVKKYIDEGVIPMKLVIQEYTLTELIKLTGFSKIEILEKFRKDIKINPSTEEPLFINGENIFRLTIATEDLTKEDKYITHDRVDHKIITVKDRDDIGIKL
jgi:hypothetical protein